MCRLLEAIEQGCTHFFRMQATCKMVKSKSTFYKIAKRLLIHKYIDNSSYTIYVGVPCMTALAHTARYNCHFFCHCTLQYDHQSWLNGTWT